MAQSSSENSPDVVHKDCEEDHAPIVTLSGPTDFTHATLPAAKETHIPIRLLRVIHAATTDSSTTELQCELVTVNILDLPSFRALSYVWGDAADIRPLILDGKRYFVTKNCHAALKCYRDQPGWGLVWIDAICINQHDASEKAIQIPLMRRIYSSAEQVVVWLGCPDDQKTASTESLERGALALLTHIASVEIKDITRVIDFESHGEDASFEWKAVSRFFQHAWFTRLWTHQEVGLSRNAVIVTHHTSMPYRVLLNALDILKVFIIAPIADTHFKRVGWDDGASSLLYQAGWRSMARDRYTLHRTLQLTKGFHCYEPRDCAFAILGLVDPAIACQIDISYSTSIAVLFAQVTQLVISTSRSLEIIAEVGCARTTQVPDLPSWVVDWSHRPIPRNLSREIGVEEHLRYRLYRAGLALPPIASFSPDYRELTLSGYAIDTVGDIMTSLHKDQQSSREEEEGEGGGGGGGGGGQGGGIFPNILHPRHLSPWHDRFTSYPTGCTPEEAYIRTILLDSTIGGYPGLSSSRLTPNGFRRYMSIYKSGPAAAETSDQADAQLQRDLSMMKKCSESHLKRRALFVTRSSGYMGLGPATLQSGDVVCVFPGCKVPLLLRRRRRGDGSGLGGDGCGEDEGRGDGREGEGYELVGECFVWGVMDGEVLTAMKKEKTENMGAAELLCAFRIC